MSFDDEFDDEMLDIFHDHAMEVASKLNVKSDVFQTLRMFAQSGDKKFLDRLIDEHKMEISPVLCIPPRRQPIWTITLDDEEYVFRVFRSQKSA